MVHARDIFNNLQVAFYFYKRCSMVGALNKLPIAVAGMIFFDDPVTLTGVMGVILAFFAGLVYSYAKSRPQMALPLYTPMQKSLDIDNVKK